MDQGSEVYATNFEDAAGLVCAGLVLIIKMKIGRRQMQFGFKVPCSSKIVGFDVHPVKPWIIIAEETGIAVIWDYTQCCSI